MSIEPVILITAGWLIVPATIGWHVCAGLRLKRQVDEDYAALRALDQKREARWRAEIAASQR